jgi:hypothetical protein
MAVRHKLEHSLDEYVKAAGIGEDGKTTLFPSAIGRSGTLTQTATNLGDARDATSKWKRPAHGPGDVSFAVAITRP